MPIEVDCPACGQRHNVPFTQAGQTQKCAACGHSMQVPTLRGMVATKSENRRPEVITPDDLFEMAYQRASIYVKAMIRRPIRSALAACLLVACLIGIGVAKRALRDSVKSEPAGQGLRADPEPWEGVGMSDSNDRVRVTAEAVTTEKPMVKPPNSSPPHKYAYPVLMVALKIENLSPDQPLPYSGWEVGSAPANQAATLKDSQGVEIKQFDGGERFVGQTSSASIPPGGSVKDLLVFQIPHSYASYVKLALPANAVGGTGNLRIKIPRTPSGD